MLDVYISVITEIVYEHMNFSFIISELITCIFYLLKSIISISYLVIYIFLNTQHDALCNTELQAGE